jgi:type I restriction enzyme S subunit
MSTILLGEIAEIESGGVFPNAYQGLASGELPFAKVADISQAVSSGLHLISTTRNYVSRQTAKTLKAIPFPANTIVFAKIGEAIRLNNRAITARAMLFDNNVMGIIPRSDEVYVKYLFYFLKTIDFYRLANTTAIPALRKTDLADLRIPLPSLSEQRELTALLDKADHLRRIRRYALQQCKALLIAEFLRRFDPSLFTHVALEDVSADEKNSFVNGPFGSDLLTKELTDSGVPVIYIRDITKGRYERKSKVFVTPQKARELDFCSVKPGDILVTKVGDPPGSAAVYPSYEDNGIVTQDVIRIRLNTDRALPSYIACLLNSPQVHREMSKIMVEGTRLRFSLGQFKQISIPVPPIEHQMRFDKFFREYERLFLAHRETLRQADHLFQTLLYESFQ